MQQEVGGVLFPAFGKTAQRLTLCCENRVMDEDPGDSCRNLTAAAGPSSLEKYVPDKRKRPWNGWGGQNGPTHGRPHRRRSQRGLHQLLGQRSPALWRGAAAPAGGHGPHANLWHWHPKGGQLGLVLAAQLRGNGKAGLLQKGLHGLHPALRILRVRQREEKVRRGLPNLNLRTWLEAEGDRACPAGRPFPPGP